MRRFFALSIIVLCLSAANAFAGAEARMSGKIVDAATGEPVANAVITYEATEMKKVKQDTKAKADGSYAIFILDGTIRYKFTIVAPGYTPYEETLKLQIGATTEKKFALDKVGTAAPKQGTMETKTVIDPGAVAYNEGADLANGGDLAGALLKFEEAVKGNPDLTAAWIALAKTAYKTKNYPRAIEAANKALEVDDEQPDLYTVLYHSYTATGDKAAAAKAEAKMPKNAGGLFNEAARLINAGNDTGAEALLKQAVAADEKFAQAYYELGMIYVRTSKNADAKAMLTKYLELEPAGKDAATAKEMLNYVK
ncbi:MAG TPA: carboxypeptidase regulatory-like domain-containing protein [Thermoanaerobaculia bacterium]|nr:carboxypeptidase regulatory-like domain-containing protein [Thermoanaerobaculia bacterium]